MRTAFAFCLGLALTAIACNDSSPAAPSSAGGTLNVMLTDSPFGDAKAVLVTFSEVSAHATGGDFAKLPFAGGAVSRTCDLKKLTSAQDVLGTGPLTPGHYTQLRLVVSSAVLYFDNAAGGAACASSIAAPGGRSAPLNVPSGDLKLNREFDITSASATTILLDFKGDESIKQTGAGSYTMTPVIAIVSVQ
jgi:hypothetical protein